MNHLALPVLIPLFTAAACLVAWRSRRTQRWLGLLGSVLHLASASVILWSVSADGIQVLRVGGWPSPFGVVFVADLFSAIMVVLGGLIGLSVAVYSLSSMDAPRESFGYYFLLQVLLAGVSGAFLTGDIFNLYVWFEVMLISSFVLMCLGGEPAQMEGSLKYVSLNLFSSAIFLAGAGILYGITGTLNFADLSVKLAGHSDPGLVTAVSMLFLVAFGIKAAVFPLFFWLPASYHTPPVAISAIFAGLLTKVGVYALIRVFSLLFTDPGVHEFILILSGLTMITGVLGAIAQNEIRRILSFHIVSQIGYMIMGLGIFTPLALAGSVFYIAHHIIVKTNLFLIAGMIHRMRNTYDLKSLGGLYRTAPWLGVLFLIPALSLAGIPPFSGFFSKLILAKAGFEDGHFWIVAISFLCGMLTIISMMKIWNEAFWKPSVAAITAPLKCPFYMVLPVVALSVMTIVIGLAGGPFFDIAMRAGEQLLRPEDYIAAVLGHKI
jgi:multicomponent Na+:H+ antiporter subunit D